MAIQFTLKELPNDSTDFTASDSVELPPKTWSVYVGDVSGGATMITTSQSGKTSTYQNIPVGSTIDIRGATLILDTGTTAAGFVVSYRNTVP